MAIKTSLTFLVFILSFFLLAASFSIAYEREDAQLDEREIEEARRGEPHDEFYQCDEPRRGRGSSQEEREQGREKEENPYYFRHDSFRGHITSQQGSIRVLERFSKRSKLLEGIENYRVTFLEANPNTFMIPGHRDADCLWVVLDGRGAVTLLQENNKETHNLKGGDIFRIRAGTTIHMVNRDNSKKLYIAELIIPVNIPDQYEPFFATGGGDQESFFEAFSHDILEAAFNTKRDQLRKLFERREKGVFVKASREQIQALSGSSSEEHEAWPFHHGGESESNRPHNLFNKHPFQSNKYGSYYKVNPNDYKQLQDLDVSVGFTNITRGGMLGPFYNSRATKIAFVASGNGYFEMACPHLREQQRGGSGSTSYEKVSARLSGGDLFVVPAGHPIVVVASNDQNLQVICFGINARDNQKYQLVGRNNILKQLEKEAKQLSFNIEATEVDEIFNQQEKSWFFAGPQQGQQHRGHASA